MVERRWRIGQLAQAVGLTVRTLRYYDAVGLLTPSGRTEAGHRLYTEADVRRLYEILALRRLSLGLQQIRAALGENGISLKAVVSQHLQEVERQIDVQTALRSRLRLALAALQQAEQPSTEVLLQAMDRMTMLERYLTPAQLAKLKEHRQQLGEEAMASAWQQRAELTAALEAAREAGEDPTSPRVQELRRQFVELHRQFIGDDEGVLRSLQTMIETEGVEMASDGTISPELHAYLGGLGSKGSKPE